MIFFLFFSYSLIKAYILSNIFSVWINFKVSLGFQGILLFGKK